MLILKKGIKVYDEIIATATTQTSYHRAKVAIAKLLEFKRNTTAIQKDNNSKAIAKRQNTLKIRKQYRNSRAKIVSDASNNANRKYKDITSPSFHLKMNSESTVANVFTNHKMEIKNLRYNSEKRKAAQ